jgi:hypothetical protein
MLVAKRDLICFGKPVRKGEPIPDPNRWDPVALQSNISIGWVGEEDIIVEKGTEAVKADSSPSNTCTQCEKSFKSSRALSVHRRSHK